YDGVLELLSLLGVKKARGCHFLSSPRSSSFVHRETFKKKHSVMKVLPSLFGCLAFHRALAQISQDPGIPSPAVPPKALESTTLLTSVINKLNLAPSNFTLNNDLVDLDPDTDFDGNDPEQVATSDSDDNDGEHDLLDTFESEVDFGSENVAMGDADGRKPPPNEDDGQETDGEGEKRKKKDKKEDKEDQVKVGFYRYKKEGCKRGRVGSKKLRQDHCQKLHRSFHSYKLKTKGHKKHKMFHKKHKEEDESSDDEPESGMNCTMHVYTDKHCSTEVFAAELDHGNCTNVNSNNGIKHDSKHEKDHDNTRYLHSRDLTGSASGPGKGKGKHKKGKYRSVKFTCEESNTGYDSEGPSNSTKKEKDPYDEPDSEGEDHDGDYESSSSSSATGLHTYKDYNSTKSAEDNKKTSSSRSHHDQDETASTKHHKLTTDAESTRIKHHKSTTDAEPTSPPDTETNKEHSHPEGISRTTKEAEGTGQSSKTVTHMITSTKRHRHSASGKALYASGLASYAASLSKYAVSMSSDPELPYITFHSGTELPTQTGSVSEVTRAPTTTDSPNPEDDKKDKGK
ncbi:hypothetical protein E4T39_04733, partial [Aureobasidium subglaciale]